MNQIYRVTANTPEEGFVSILTLDETIARREHSNLLGRQIDKDGTNSVKVELIKL